MPRVTALKPRGLLFGAVTTFLAAIGLIAYAVLCESPGDLETVSQVRELLSRAVNVDVSSDDTDLIESGLLDSLALVELLVGIEREFGVQVDLGELNLDDFRTVRRIAETVERFGDNRPVERAPRPGTS